MLVDSHCHIQSQEFDGDREAVLERARQAGLGALVVVGTDVASSAAAVAFASQQPDLLATVGCHPHEAGGFDQGGLKALRELSRAPVTAAIGEIGLDFYRNLSPPKAQVAVFQMLLDLAAEESRPVVIHSRAADGETFKMLERWVGEVSPRWPHGRPLGVMHCFAGDLALAIDYMEMGFLISIAGPVTYPKSDRIVEVAKGIPLAGMLVETDAPYLPPQAHRGRRNEPAYLPETVARIAERRGQPFEAVAQATTANARRLFGLREATTAPAGRLEGRG